MKNPLFKILSTALVLPSGIALSEPQSSSKPGPTLPTSGTSQLYVDVAPSNAPKSLKELSDLSSLIVEGVVARTLPSRKLDGSLLETDSVITITKTVKGSTTASTIAISQLGGTIGGLTIKPARYSLVQPGETYLLCLQVDNRTNIPAIPGLQRYIVSGVWSGLLFFGADGLLHVNAASPDLLRKQFEGTSLASMIELVNNAMAQPQTQKPVLPPFPGIQK